jgi:hypothetical protein
MPKNPAKPPAEKPAQSAVATSTPQPWRWQPTHWLLLGVLSVAAYLRVSHVGLLEFKADEANAAILAVKFATGEMFPRVGLTYSVGVRQAPLYLYILMPFFFISRSPAFFTVAYGLISAAAVGLCYWIGRRWFNEKIGLVAAALFAVSPWAVIYSRKIWPQDFMPVCCTVLLWMWYEFLIEKRRGYLMWIVLLSIAAWQVHLTASNVLATGGVLWLLCRYPLNWKQIGIAIGINALLLAPYVTFEMEQNWEDFRRASSVVEASNQGEVYTVQGIHPQYGYPLPTRDQFSLLLNTVSGGQMEDILGLSTAQFNAEDGLMKALVKTVKLLFLCALVMLAVTVIREGRAAARFPCIDLASEPRLTVLFLWVTMPVIFFSAVGLRTYLSYFSLTMPAIFLVTAWGLDSAQRFFSSRSGVGATVARGLWVVFALVVLGQFAYVEKLYGYLEREGGARGTYGVVYEHKVALAKHIADAAQTANPIMSLDWPPKTPVESDIQYLVEMDLEGRSLPPQTGGPQTAFVVVDTRFRDPNEPEPLPNIPAQAFGPLRLYEISYTPSVR